MQFDVQKHQRFFSTEISTQLTEWENYLNKSMSVLISEKQLFVGRVISSIDDSGLIQIRFRRSEVPRINTPYFLGVVGNDAKGNPKDWSFTYKDFRYSTTREYWHKKRGGDVKAIQYQKTQEDWAFMNVSVTDLRLFDYLKNDCLVEDVQPLIIFAETDPPISYLSHLKSFVEENGDHPILKSNINLSEESWKPTGIDNEIDTTEELLSIISVNHVAAIQGPPGTGKSYSAAKVAQRLIDNNLSVAVTALTNMALMELSGQPPIEDLLNSGKVYKTTLSRDELAKQPNLRLADNYTPEKGRLLLTTYYKLSDYIREKSITVPIFDLLIIEEASQAFLATFALFSGAAKKILIIGDHKQLPPVVQTNTKVLHRLDPKIDRIINGLQTYMLNNEEHSYRFTKTRRLSREASSLTGLFYNNELSSISPLNDVIQHSKPVASLFHSNGGVSAAFLKKAGRESSSQEQILKAISNIVTEILNSDKAHTVSVLISTVYLEKLITSILSQKGIEFSRLTVSTVHKAQGITTDYTIYYMPLSHADFELNTNLFNVATSRAKKGTLIISFDHLSLISGVGPKVSQFLNMAEDVSKEMSSYIIKHT